MMKTHRQPPPKYRDESGQAALVVALFFFFVFLVFASLGVDGAAFYLTRRDLQSVADAAALAACTVLAQPQGYGVDPVPLAYAAAENEIAENLGSWAPFVGDNPPATNIGTGVGLLKGIEVTDPVVRVALQRPVPTVLTQFVGRTDTIVTAQARCDSRAGGGLMPIAVRRYDIDTYVDYIAEEGAPLYPSDSYTETIYYPTARYWPFFEVPLPWPEYEASDSIPGPEVVLLGRAAETNNGESSMRNLVLLDIRNVAPEDELEYYNFDGEDPSQADAAKDMSQDWIYQHGYPGPYPQIGSQIAILDGASTNMAAGAMYQADYQVGDVVAAIVYDGFVWSKPEFAVNLEAVSNDGIAPSRPDSSTPVQYTVSIGCPSPCPTTWNRSLYFGLTFDLTNKPDGSLPPGMQMELDGVSVTPGVTYPLPNPVPQSGWSGTLLIWNTATITEVAQYLSGLNLSAVSDLGITRGASSNFGWPSISGYDFTLRSDHGKLVVHQGDTSGANSSGANPVTYGAGSSIPGSGCRDVPMSAKILLSGTEQPWTNYFSSSSPNSILVNIRKDRNQLTFPLDVLPGAQTGSYTLRITVGGSSFNCGSIPEHTEDIPITIATPVNSATPNKFVFIQGYAVFKITRYDPPNSGNPNTVYARAITKIYKRYEDITVGLRPRLVPW